MNFQAITEILEKRELQNPSLDFLNPDNSLYDTLFLQLHEDVIITENSIRVRNRERTVQKLSNFFNIAVSDNVDLAITPEYSCPIDVISNLLSDNIFPQENKMWIIGCESILPADLNDLIADNEDFEWIYERDLIERNLDSNDFLNPVIYLFNVRNNNQEIIRICLLQFKTFPLGGSDWEQRSMIRGNDVYLIENDENSIKIITLICSDVLNPSFSPQQRPRFIHEPYLFVHVQLNTAPNHHDFNNYRQSIFQQNMDNKEVFCLNWSRGIELSTLERESQYGATALYVKSKELDLTDEKLGNNHQLGLYYTYWQNRRTNVYFFNYDEFVFKMRTTKASQASVLGVNSGRIGPEIKKVFQWNNDWRNIEEVEDGFNSICEHIEGEEKVSLETFKSKELSTIDTERLLALSVGEIVGENWFSVKNLKFFVVDDQEIVHRITFTQHPNEYCISNRKKYLRRCATLENVIINGQTTFPENITDLQSNCSLQYRPDEFESKYNFNLYPNNNGSSPATVAYIGNQGPSDAYAIRDKMVALFKDSQFGKRVVVWYSDINSEIQSCIVDTKPKINENTAKSRQSISKTRE